MKAILYCPESSTEWIRKFFPDYPPYLLRFGNKPYLGFLVDFCILSGIREIRIVSDNPTSELYDHFGDGMPLGIQISYAAAHPEETLKKLLLKNRAFCAGDDLLLLSGMIWIDYDKRKPEPLQFDADTLCGRAFTETDGWYLIGRNRFPDFPDTPAEMQLCSDILEVTPVDSIQMFYQQNMRIVYEQSACYNLPGYGDSATFIIGRDVEIPKSVTVSTPVILGSSIQLGKDSCIGPGAIIGDNSLIANGVILNNAIVMGNTYVGSKLQFEDKIIYRNYIIDPRKGVKLDIVDEFLLTPLVKQGYWSCPVTQRVIALLMLVFYFIPFLLFRPFIRIHAEEVECYMNQQRKRKLKLHLYIQPPDSFPGRYFLKFSLDRYHLLPLVLTGRLRLVGSYILEATPENARILKQFPDYAPGIFSYSEYLQHDNDPFQREIDELYYMYHASFWNNFKILKGILMRNLLKRT